MKTDTFSSQKPGYHLCFLPSYPCSTQLITRSLCFCLTYLSCPLSPHSTRSSPVSGPLMWTIAVSERAFYALVLRSFSPFTTDLSMYLPYLITSGFPSPGVYMCNSLFSWSAFFPFLKNRFNFLFWIIAD